MIRSGKQTRVSGSSDDDSDVLLEAAGSQKCWEKRRFPASSSRPSVVEQPAIGGPVGKPCFRVAAGSSAKLLQTLAFEATPDDNDEGSNTKQSCSQSSYSASNPHLDLDGRSEFNDARGRSTANFMPQATDFKQPLRDDTGNNAKKIAQSKS